MWYDEFDSVFWLSVCTMLFGGIGLGLKYCFKSKCDNIDLCGCIKIHRNVQAEIELEEKLNEGKNEENV